jgi:hypothetical protein
MTDDPLLGCRLKLQGAWRHRQALGEELQMFLERADPEPSPLHLGVIVGDFLHNLRCVLDHLVWQLVVLNGQEPSDHNQFPIFDTPDAYKKKAGRYLRGIAADHRALVETFQPYHLGDDAASHYLAVLRDLSNIDKHRFVHPVVIVGEGDAREVRFTELEVTTDALFRLEHYITYTLFKRFESIFPLPAHAVDNVITNAVHDAIGAPLDLIARVAPAAGASPQEYDDDGWPLGFTPPRGLRSRVRSTSRANRRAGGSRQHKQTLATATPGIHAGPTADWLTSCARSATPVGSTAFASALPPSVGGLRASCEHGSTRYVVLCPDESIADATASWRSGSTARLRRSSRIVGFPHESRNGTHEDQKHPNTSTEKRTFHVVFVQNSERQKERCPCANA